MAKSSAAPSTRARGGWLVLLSLILVLVSVTVVSAQGGLTPASLFDQQYSWDPSSAKWIHGENKGYSEGQTAAMVAALKVPEGGEYDLPICLQVTESPFTAAYGFLGFEPFDTTVSPPTLPGDEPIDYLFNAPWYTDFAPLIYGYNIEITGVTPQAVGLPDCYANEIGVVVSYKSHGNGYIVWGGHIAKPTDPIPDGVVPGGGGTVPENQGASWMTGNFQARIRTASADKTLPFVVEPAANAVELSSFGATASQVLPYGLSLLGLAAAGAAGFAFRRRKQG
jgi:hypothetical protein